MDSLSVEEEKALLLIPRKKGDRTEIFLDLLQKRNSLKIRMVCSGGGGVQQKKRLQSDFAEKKKKKFLFGEQGGRNVFWREGGVNPPIEKERKNIYIVASPGADIFPLKKNKKSLQKEGKTPISIGTERGKRGFSDIKIKGRERKLKKTCGNHHHGRRKKG